MSFRREFAEGYRQAGIRAGRILKGAKTTDLPVMQPTKFEMVVNLRTARASGLAISESFLLRADEVSEASATTAGKRFSVLAAPRYAAICEDRPRLRWNRNRPRQGCVLQRSRV
jgi:hypothetical protein